MRISLVLIMLLQFSIFVTLGAGLLPSAYANVLHDTLIESSQEARFTLSPSNMRNPVTRLELTTTAGKQTFELTENETLLDSISEFTSRSELTVYKGKISGNLNSWARFTDNNGKISGAYFDGTSLFFVSQQTQIDAELGEVQRFQEQGAELLVYNANQIRHSGTCALHDEASTEAFSYQGFVEQLTQMMANAASKELKVSLTADTEFEAASPEDAAIEMIAEMNVVDGIFAEQLGVTISINEIRVLTNNGNLTVTDAVDLIIAYRTYVSTQYNNPGASHLFTGKNLDGSTIGIAYVGALCNSYAVGVTQRFGNNTALVTAHEFGHNFGAPHDNQNGSACASTPGIYLMNPGINGSDQFSDCSIANMQPYVDQAQCLVDVSPPTINSSANTNAEVAVPYQYDADGFVEADGSGDIAFTLDFGPDGMTVSVEGEVLWIPSEQQVGVHSVQITATSQYGSDSQLFDVEVDAPAEAEYFDFTGKPITSFGGKQDVKGTYAITNSGAGIRLVGNRWKKVDFDYQITPNTVLEFDFKSTKKGEVHAIGFDTDDAFEQARSFMLFGTQPWGIQDFTYNSLNQTQHFVIPVGEYYQGIVSNMYFIMDNDIFYPRSDAEFSYIQVYEAEEEDDQASQLEINFNQVEITSYGTNQKIKGSHQVLDDGLTLKLDGNVWRKIPLSIEITRDTIIEFDYKSDLLGEVHGLGFSVNNDLSRSTTFALMGTQIWGITDFNYTGNGEYQHFEIPVGDYYTGAFQYLIFSMDNDVFYPRSNSYFKNIVIRE
ncbi:M12 family metallo-peptidase [Aliiglaciecola litoralis]|uniref:Peptidase M12B domain-containing protein n=1 Tax=Aliiglaciecola litoralis TaxID=582857 RepID=A0ABP3WPE4_9ALTE